MNHHRLLRRRSFLGAISLGAAIRPAFSGSTGVPKGGSLHAVGNVPIILPVNPDMVRSAAASINDHCQVAISAYVANVGNHVFFWDGGKDVTDLGVLPGDIYSTANAINNRGEIVGWSSKYWGGQYLNAALFRYGRPPQYLPPLPGHDTAIPSGINDAGVICGLSMPAQGGPRAVIWRNGQVIDLGDTPFGEYADAWAINNAGDVVGRSSGNGTPPHAFLWSNGKWTGLGTLPGNAPNPFDSPGGPFVFTETYAISDPGEVTGQCAPSNSQSTSAFRWRHGEMTKLTEAPTGTPYVSTGMAINNEGTIVGRLWTGNRWWSISYAAVWDKFNNLSYLPSIAGPGNYGDYAVPTGINNRGQAVGYSYLASKWDDVAVIWNLT